MPLKQNSQKLMEPFFDTYDKISWKPNTIKSILINSFIVLVVDKVCNLPPRETLFEMYLVKFSIIIGPTFTTFTCTTR